MNNPDKFILTSDYATLKNDSPLTLVSLTIPAGSIPAASGATPTVVTYQTTFSIGKVNASIRSRARDVTNGSDWVIGAQLFFDLMVWQNYPGYPDPSPQTHSCILERISPTEMRIYTDVINFADRPLFIRRNEVIQFELVTFLTPFI